MFLTITATAFLWTCPPADAEHTWWQSLLCKGDGMTDPPYTSQPRSDYPQVKHGVLRTQTVEGQKSETRTTTAPRPKPTKDKKPNPGKSKGHFK